MSPPSNMNDCRSELEVLGQLHLVLTGLGVITPRNMCLLNLYVPMFLQSNFKNENNFGKLKIIV